MLGWIREKMDTPEPAPRGGKFSTSDSITAGNDTLACNDPCALGGDYRTIVGNSSWVNAHTFDLSHKASATSWW
jgi:hypothetical protein